MPPCGTRPCSARSRSPWRALVALLTRSRFQAAQPKDKLPALFAESLERQEEVTEQLGRQVREAVELLVTTLDQLDRESNGTLLAGVSDDDFYAGVVTMMMRVVFLLFAEERRLLPSDDDLYVTAYSVGHLVEQLEQADSLGAVLGQRTAAWHRLLAVTRAVHSGVAHEDLRLPAYGGGLFDPDRYPWLEGRPDAGTPAAAARPPAVDDRTVLRMLRAVQYVVIGGERRRLTFRALDVEQIGYVYEGLLELEVRTATETVLGLARPSKWPQKIKEDAEVALSQATGLTVKELHRPHRLVGQEGSGRAVRRGHRCRTVPRAPPCRRPTRTWRSAITPGPRPAPLRRARPPRCLPAGQPVRDPLAPPRRDRHPLHAAVPRRKRSPKAPCSPSSTAPVPWRRRTRRSGGSARPSRSWT